MTPLEQCVPERMPEDAWKAGDDFAAGKLYGWNDCREEMLRRIAALKGAGNAWVPQVAIEIMKGIKAIDKQRAVE
jgi:hypothetical protein